MKIICLGLKAISIYDHYNFLKYAVKHDDHYNFLEYAVKYDHNNNVVELENIFMIASFKFEFVLCETI